MNVTFAFKLANYGLDMNYLELIESRNIHNIVIDNKKRHISITNSRQEYNFTRPFSALKEFEQSSDNLRYFTVLYQDCTQCLRCLTENEIECQSILERLNIALALSTDTKFNAKDDFIFGTLLSIKGAKNLRWQTRWVTLDKKKLSLFKNKDAREEIRVFSLETCKFIPGDPKEKKDPKKIGQI